MSIGHQRGIFPARHGARLVALLSVFLLFPACMYVPYNSPRDSRGVIHEDNVESLEEERRGKDDVVLRFGEPDWWSEDEGLLAYFSNINTATLSYGILVYRKCEYFERTLLLLRFNAGGFLASYKVTRESDDACTFGFDPLWFLPLPSRANPFSWVPASAP
jgi:hypothetical protein